MQLFLNAKLWAPDSERGAPARQPIAVLEDGAELFHLLSGEGILAVRAAESVAELAELVAAGDVLAVVVDPELTIGWPTSIAEQVVAKVDCRAPIILVCRSQHDASIIRERLGERNVVVLLRGELTGADLAQIISGAIARYRHEDPRV